MDQDIKLIIKEEISLLLTAGDKIVTKNEEISLVAGFLCKGCLLYTSPSPRDA